ncbi:hypothetical protein PVAP13_1KG305105 [Panicum virgatum]|uniref:Uncharacterized protein n=1 Tax=Panicum virgatum TaxID=38727 RepID=A0A8T0XAZ9_PANVG|nr:hypothetical protein PVAP13_1KG305105 [Panicum virgatum]
METESRGQDRRSRAAGKHGNKIDTRTKIKLGWNQLIAAAAAAEGALARVGAVGWIHHRRRRTCPGMCRSPRRASPWGSTRGASTSSRRSGAGGCWRAAGAEDGVGRRPGPGALRGRPVADVQGVRRGQGGPLPLRRRLRRVRRPRARREEGGHLHLRGGHLAGSRRAGAGRLPAVVGSGGDGEGGGYSFPIRAPTTCLSMIERIQYI